MFSLFFVLLISCSESASERVARERPEVTPELPIEVGYRLSPEYWGRGYATEIAKHLVSYGFEEMQAKNLCAVAHKEHQASLHVLKKAGFIFVREDNYYDHNCLYFEYLASSYQN